MVPERKCFDSKTTVSGRSMAMLAFLLLLLGLCTYWSSLSNSFHLDDKYRIVDNPSIRSLDSPGVYFSDPSTNATLPELWQWRPLVTLSLALNFAAHGIKVEGFRLTNLALLILAGLLGSLLTLEIIKTSLDTNSPSRESWLLATIVGILFLVHPFSAFTVNYIGARDLLFMEVFFLASLIAYLKFRRSQKPFIFLSLSQIFLALSLMAKENSGIFPLIVLGVEIFFRNDSNSRKTALLGVLSSLFTVVIVYLTVSYSLDFSDTKNTISMNLDSLSYLRNQAQVHLYYLSGFVWPAPLRPFAEIRPIETWTDPAFLLLSTVFAASFALAWRLRRSNTILAFSIYCYWILLAPTSSVLPLIHLSMPYRPFPSSLFLYIGFASLLINLSIRNLLLVTLPFLLAAAFATQSVNASWKSQRTLWEHTMKHGGNANAHLAYAVTVVAPQDLEQQRHYLRKSLELNPNYMYGNIIYGQLLIKLGEIKAGIQHLEKAVSLNATSPTAHLALSRALVGVKEHKRAYMHALLAVKYSRNSAQSRAWLKRFKVVSAVK